LDTQLNWALKEQIDQQGKDWLFKQDAPVFSGVLFIFMLVGCIMSLLV